MLVCKSVMLLGGGGAPGLAGMLHFMLLCLRTRHRCVRVGTWVSAGMGGWMHWWVARMRRWHGWMVGVWGESQHRLWFAVRSQLTVKGGSSPCWVGWHGSCNCRLERLLQLQAAKACGPSDMWFHWQHGTKQCGSVKVANSTHFKMQPLSTTACTCPAQHCLAGCYTAPAARR